MVPPLSFSTRFFYGAHPIFLFLLRPISWNQQQRKAILFLFFFCSEKKKKVQKLPNNRRAVIGISLSWMKSYSAKVEIRVKKKKITIYEFTKLLFICLNNHSLIFIFTHNKIIEEKCVLCVCSHIRVDKVLLLPKTLQGHPRQLSNQIVDFNIGHQIKVNFNEDEVWKLKKILIIDD